MPEPTSYTPSQGTPQENQGNVVSPNEDVIYTRKSIGYADGYSQYDQRTGAHTPDGTEIVERITKSNDPKEHEKYVSPELLLDVQSNKFRRINGYGGQVRADSSDYYEDPTFLIFDLKLKRNESALFREDVILAFINDYVSIVPELAERQGYWEEFVNRLFKIFPSDNTGDNSGMKRHYIEAVGGLDVLLNPIINYPEDNITITLTEDVTMSLQYLAELYNNLIYSYDTHRYLIPDNLLRFNMEITVRDIRNMKVAGTYNNRIEDNINNSISKFIYVLHDCQFNFMKTKNFGAEIRRGGFGAAPASISAGGVIEVNFKSYSKITAALLGDNNKIIDFRERETQSLSQTMKDEVYQTDSLSSDYKSQTEVKEIEKANRKSVNTTYRGRAFTNPVLGSNFGVKFPEINTDVRGFFGKDGLIAREAREVQNVIIKQIYSEAQQILTAGERLIGNKLGFTLGKTNVYYMSLEEKALTRFAFMFEDLVRGESNVLHGAVKDLGRVWSNKNLSNEQKKDAQSALWNQTMEEMGTTAKDRLGQYYDPNYTFVKPLNDPNVYDPTTDKLFTGGKIDLSSTGHTDKPLGKIDLTKGTHPDKPLGKIDLSKTGHTSKEGDVYMAGHHTIDLSSTGHTSKEGAVYMAGHHKIDSGSTAHPDKPLGTIDLTSTTHPDKPLGTIDLTSTAHPDTTSDRIYPDGIYNQKLPSGDLHPDGIYNQKFPSGDLHPDGIYNQKFPSGDLHPDGIYNQKFPSGDLHPDGIYNQKFPSGDLNPDGIYNQKFPSGDLHPDGQYNEKFPEGVVQPQGQYNEKFPSGDLNPDGTYNEKFPEGTVEPQGKYNDKPPSGNIYGKNKPLPPTLKGNVYKNKE